MKIDLYDIVQTLVKRENVAIGEIGTVVNIIGNGKLYVVEFLYMSGSEKGYTKAVLEFNSEEISAVFPDAQQQP